MSGLTGFVGGVLGLTLLDATLVNAQNASTLVSVPADWLARWLDPNTPLIPDLRKKSHGKPYITLAN